MRRGSGLDALGRAVDHAHRSGEPLAVAFIDLDGLKRINDEHGHAAGDHLLQSVVRLMHANLRSYDVVIRYGGDEFVCTLVGMSLEQARRRMGAVRNAICRELGRSAITIGLADLEPGERAADLIARADESLYARRASERFARGTADPAGGRA